ncbi:DUF6036 family nucleotidyltransferase [Limisphaera sp. 4302-co]|uniref:DUF6036 family nucleotidyltransferase n=1 Tax=Limisphaera sp. 4302-co TaxID=3400417 RepID=UPI003C1F75C7
MRAETDRAKLEAFVIALGRAVRGPGRIYLAGGATAVWYGWRQTTVDVDLKADPEPAGFYEALAELKDRLGLNVELAAPDQFLPPLPGWQDRSLWIAQHGPIQFYHYDPYAQALAKLHRRHQRDLQDIEAMRRHGWIQPQRLHELFRQIEPQLIRYPAVDIPTLRRIVEEYCRGAT